MRLHLPSEKSNNTRRSINSSLISSFIMIMCCVVCLTGSTWSWFTANTSVKTADIMSATYDIVYKVVDADGNEVQPVDGAYNLDPAVVYTVTITATGTASTGYADVNIEGVGYVSQPLAPGESISFKVGGYETLTTESSWGTKDTDDPVEDLDEFYKDFTVTYYAYGNDPKVIPAGEGVEAVSFKQSTENISKPITLPAEDEVPEYDGYEFVGWSYSDGTPYDADKDVISGDTALYATYNKTVPDTVKLMPQVGNTTTMIERGGAVETYNAEIIEKFGAAKTTLAKRSAAPVGVTSIVEADESITYATPTSYTTWFVYGLTTGINTKTLEKDYVRVTNGGTITYENLGPMSRIKTGTVINVIDTEGNTVEKFYIVIYGDIDGNGAINATDVTMLNTKLNAVDGKWRTLKNEEIAEELIPCTERAANLDNNTSVDATDATIFNETFTLKDGSSVTLRTINQITGKSAKN